MPLSDLEVAIAAARAGAEVVRDGFGRPQVIEHKSAIDLVTATDRESEAVIMALLQRERPDHGLLSEEGASRPGEHRWIVDPLDGTTNFAHGLPHFCVSVALCHGDEPLVGAIADPVREELFVAQRGQGAWRRPLWRDARGDQLRVSRARELLQGLFSAGFPYDREGDAYARLLRAWGRLSRAAQAMRRTGSAALDLAYVAAGRLDGFLVAGAKPWDMAAGMLLIHEAGGRVTTLAGDTATLDSTAWLASNGALHDELLELVNRT